ncbi:ATP-binding protein [Aestuariibacter salexigens]|uniref:ATP-binding protein n=1 Tax=Aestuariibacter salexigens TaxID=226010 RepID=UPI00040D7767|nr:ATP-binding protein [Aestuariibacter salexigens]
MPTSYLSSDKEQLKHAYITALLRALVWFSIPLLLIVVYFNAVDNFRPVPLFALSAIILMFYSLHHYRQHLNSSALSLTLSIIILLIANINAVVNGNVTHAAVALLISTFSISVVTHRAVTAGYLLIATPSLLLSVGVATQFQYEGVDLRWLLVMFVGQLVILSGMRLLFMRAGQFVEREHQLRLDSEAAAREKSRFLANMSHEIRTPIAGVVGMLDLIDDPSLDAQQRRKLALARQSAELLSNIVNDTLDYSKIEAGKLALSSTAFCLDELIVQVLAIVEPKASENGNRLQVKKGWQGKKYVQGDKTRLQQVLLNLLSNAAKFTHQGSIELSADLLQEGKQWRFTCEVKDSGIGMSPEQLATLFKPFQQVDNSSTKLVQGTGLGLVICKQILKLMGGTIHVQSEPENGSAFSIEVMLGMASAPNESLHDNTLKVEELTGMSLLVVEDNLINQTILQEVLEGLGVNVSMADNGEDAIRFLQTSKPENIDVILMDCQMPVMDGYQASLAIRSGLAGEAFCQIPIIALTANALEGDREKCLAAGMNDYLSKPVDKHALVNIIKKLIS